MLFAAVIVFKGDNLKYFVVMTEEIRQTTERLDLLIKKKKTKVITNFMLGESTKLVINDIEVIVYKYLGY